MVFKLRYLDPKSHDLSTMCSLSGFAAIILDVCISDMGAETLFSAGGLNDYLLLSKQSQHLSCPKGNPMLLHAIDL